LNSAISGEPIETLDVLSKR